MRVVTINGQNHKGSTYHIGRMLAEKLCDGDEIEEIFLPRDFPYFCTGCSQCFLKSETLCPHYEALKPLVEKLDHAPDYDFYHTGLCLSRHRLHEGVSGSLWLSLDDSPPGRIDVS